MDNKSTLPTLVELIDNSLTYEGFLGWGAYGNVVKVRKKDGIFALKISRHATVSLAHEFEVQKALSGIIGIPEAVQLYNENAFLMEFIDGKQMSEVGRVDETFFDKLKTIARQINVMGYFISWDFCEQNILVDSRGDPWVIDFEGARYARLPVSREVFDMSEILIRRLENRYRGCKNVQ